MKNKTIALTVASVSVVAAAVLFVKYDEWIVIPKYRAVISADLKDPDSTQFRNEKLIPGGWLCGELNSQNGLGSFVGFKKYVVSTNGEAYLEDQGYVGKKELSTEKIVAGLDEKVKFLKEMNSLNASTGLALKISDSEIEAAVNQRKFKKLWADICGT